MVPGILLEGRTGGASFLLCVCYLYVDLGLGYLLNNIQLFAVYIISIENSSSFITLIFFMKDFRSLSD
jgi:hypothetical protein